MSFVRWVVAVVLGGAAVSSGSSVWAQDTGSPEPIQIDVLDARPAQIRELIDGTLDVTIAAESLFDVSLSDEGAIQVEVKRLSTLLAAVSEDATSGAATSASSAGLAPADQAPSPVASLAASTGESAETSGAAPASLTASESWRQRLELDRARLTFYSLDAARRGAILETHSQRRAAAEQRLLTAPAADLQREQALAAAKAARAEAERLVSKEVARLGILAEQVRGVQAHFQARRSELSVRKDLTFGWQRRASDARAADAIAADATYDALQRQLRSSREELEDALRTLEAASEVPDVGANLLHEIPGDVPTDVARERRIAAERAIAEAQRDELDFREERCATLLDEVTALNRERLGLLPFLTVAKRQAVTGLSAASWEQALAEAKHLSLVLRYHQHVARRWLLTVRSGETSAVSPWAAAAFFVPLTGVLLVFVWGRRKIQLLLQLAEKRLASVDRSNHRTTQSPARHFLRILLAIHRPLEWMVLLTVVLELMPHSARTLVEVQLLSSIAIWFLMGALVVNTINALAAGRGDVFASADGEADLRLRSLRFVGATVVVFGLTLVLCARLVGQGTIYSWVSATAWWATVPVFLTLVRWWRETVFQRLDRVRKKSPLQAWVLANRSGWQSFLAAMVGALALFTTGTLRILRSWLSGFDIARRVHAYLFKREIERLGEGLTELAPLSLEIAEVLHPERPLLHWIACPADGVLTALERRCATERGGVVAVYAGRGMGKTSLLHALKKRIGTGATFVECTTRTSLDDLRQVARSITDMGAPQRVVLADEAQTLIEARIGGLDRFDQAIAWMRSAGEGVTWVLAVDAALWPLLQRARDSRPLFDECHALEPWHEAQIGALLTERCEQAGVSPNYVDLLEKLPAAADEIERQEALDAKRAGYQRMLWDHVGGNPGLALQAWRASLAQDTTGEVRVRSLQTPDMETLESLPDASLFVVRAVLQLAPAAVHAVAQATRLRPEEVMVDFRFGKSRGYFEDVEGGVRVAWPWLGAVTRLLARRRLLVIS